MTELTWNEADKRLYEVGVDRGVLFPPSGPGVAWNGLVSVKQQPSGGEPTPYYMDGVKYLNRPSVEEFKGVLDAYTYPEEFEEFDGYPSENGLSFGQQTRREFNLCYRTLLGNAVQGQDYGYKLHFLYNVLASPSARDYKTIGSSTDPVIMSWNLSTTPIAIAGRRPTAHLSVNSTRVDPHILGVIEQFIYGTEHTPPRMLTPARWVRLLALDAFEIEDEVASGLWNIIPPGDLDLVGQMETGIYDITPGSKLIEVSPGIYSMES